MDGSLDFSETNNMYRELSMTNLCSLEDESISDVRRTRADQSEEAAPSGSSSPHYSCRRTASLATHSPSSSISFPAVHIDIPEDCNSSPRDSTNGPLHASKSTAAPGSSSKTSVIDQEDEARLHSARTAPSRPVSENKISSRLVNCHDLVLDDETYCSDSISIQDPWSADASDGENVRSEHSFHHADDVLAFDGSSSTVDAHGKQFFNYDADAAKINRQASEDKDLEFKSSWVAIDAAIEKLSTRERARASKDTSRCNVVRTRRSWSQPASPVASKAYKLTIPEVLFSGPLPHLHSVSGGSPRIHDPADVFTATASSPIPTPRRSGNYGLFRTRSTSRVNLGRIHLEPELRRSSSLHRHGEIEEEIGWSDVAALEAAPAVSPGRYFDALEGPELEKPKDSENLLLPSDELWPFLLRFPIAVFRISLGLGCQSILWRDLHELQCLQSFVYVPYVISEVIWWLALASLLLLTIIYVAKCVVYFEAVRREFYHPVRVNYFFSPWITALFLAQTVPRYLTFSTSTNSTTLLQLFVPSPALWCVVMVPIVALELKLYGQWLSGGERRLSKVANPSTHMSVVGNFVGAKVAVLVGWREAAVLFWAVGLAHYLVLFVTLYQRLPTNVMLPKEMHPVYFLFVAVPSSASVAWRYITGQFGSVCKILFFISLFLYSSLGVRFNFFRGCRFSILWWAYTFPMSVAAIAAIQYSKEVTTPLTQALALLLTFVASVMVLLLFILTLLHTFVWRSLFPNDMAIAITATKNKKNKIRKSKQSSNNSSTQCAVAADKELLNPYFLVNMGTELGIKEGKLRLSINKISSLSPSLNSSAVFEVGR